MFKKSSFRLAYAGVILALFTGCGAPQSQTTPGAPDSSHSAQETEGNQSGSYITVAEAKAAVLDNAELSQEEVQFVRVQLDSENSTPAYDIEFICQEAEYDYMVDAVTGEILSMDCEMKKYDMETVSQEAVQVGDTQPESGEQYIGNEAAKQAALSHAGLNAADVHFVHAHLEWDDGKWMYDVEFHKDNMEYDYDIDALTGEVLSFDHDAEYYQHGADNTAEGGQITEERAKQIALEYAGVEEKDTQNLTIEFDYDDGRAEYEIEWYVGRMEYSCDVDAGTGEILSFEKEID